MDLCPACNSAEFDTMEAHCEAYIMSLVGAYHQLSSMIRYEVGSQLALFVSYPALFHSQVALGVLVDIQSSKDRVFSPCASHPVLRAHADSHWNTRFSVSGAAFEFMGGLIH